MTEDELAAAHDALVGAARSWAAEWRESQAQLAAHGLLPRFYVAEVVGYAQLTRSGAAPGISCHVLDRLNNCAIVATFRSEDRLPTEKGYTLGVPAARAAAEELAEELNRSA